FERTAKPSSVIAEPPKRTPMTRRRMAGSSSSATPRRSMSPAATSAVPGIGGTSANPSIASVTATRFPARACRASILLVMRRRWGIGIVLVLLCGSTACSSGLPFGDSEERRAVVIAEEYLTAIVDGRVEDAHAMMSDPSFAPLPDEIYAATEHRVESFTIDDAGSSSFVGATLESDEGTRGDRGLRRSGCRGGHRCRLVESARLHRHLRGRPPADQRGQHPGPARGRARRRDRVPCPAGGVRPRRRRGEPPGRG